MSYNTQFQLGKRSRDDDSDDEPEEKSRKNIFKYLMFYVFPSNIGDGRLKVLHNLIKKYGGNFTHAITNHTTHVLVDESVSCSKICRFLGWTTFPPHVNVVYIHWLSASIRAETCLRTSDYQVPSGHKPTFIISCVNSGASKNSPFTHYVKTKNQAKVKHPKPPRTVEVVDADMSNIESIEEEDSSFDDGIYDGETSCDDEWLYTVPAESLNTIIPPSYICPDSINKASTSSNTEQSESTGILKLRLYRHKSAGKGYQYSRYSNINGEFQLTHTSSTFSSSVSDSAKEAVVNQKLNDPSQSEDVTITVQTPPVSLESSHTTELELQNVTQESKASSGVEFPIDSMINLSEKEEIEKTCIDKTDVDISVNTNEINSGVKKDDEIKNTSNPNSDASPESLKLCSPVIQSPDSPEVKFQDEEACKLSLTFDSEHLSDKNVESLKLPNTLNSSMVTSSSNHIISSNEIYDTSKVSTNDDSNPIKLDDELNLSPQKSDAVKSSLETDEMSKTELTDLKIPGEKYTENNDDYETQVSKISSTTEVVESTSSVSAEIVESANSPSNSKDSRFSKLNSKNVPSSLEYCEPNSMSDLTEASHSKIMEVDSFNTNTVSANVILKTSEILKGNLQSDQPLFSKALKADTVSESETLMDSCSLSEHVTSIKTFLLDSETHKDMKKGSNEQNSNLISDDIKKDSSECNSSNERNIIVEKPNDNSVSEKDLSDSEKNSASLTPNSTFSSKQISDIINSDDMEKDSSMKKLPDFSNFDLKSSDKSFNLNWNKTSELMRSANYNSSVTVSDPSVKFDKLSNDQQIPLFKTTLSDPVSGPELRNDSCISDNSNIEISLPENVSCFLPVRQDSLDSSARKVFLLDKSNSMPTRETTNELNNSNIIDKLPDIMGNKTDKDFIKKISSTKDDGIKLKEKIFTYSDVSPLKDANSFEQTKEVSDKLSLNSDEKEESSVFHSVIVNTLDFQSLCEPNPIQSSEIASETNDLTNFMSSTYLAPFSKPSLLTGSLGDISLKQNSLICDKSAKSTQDKMLNDLMPSKELSKKLSDQPIVSVKSVDLPEPDSQNFLIPKSKVNSEQSSSESFLSGEMTILPSLSIKSFQSKDSDPNNIDVTFSKEFSVPNLLSESFKSKEPLNKQPTFKIPLQKSPLKSLSPDSVGHSNILANQTEHNSTILTNDFISFKHQSSTVSLCGSPNFELTSKSSKQNIELSATKPFECGAILSELPEPMDFATAETNLEATLNGSLSNIAEDEFKLQSFYDHESLMKDQDEINLSNTTHSNHQPLALTFNSRLSDSVGSKYGITELSETDNLIARSSLNSCMKDDLEMLCEEAVEMDSLISGSVNCNQSVESIKSSALITDENSIGISALDTFNAELKGFDATLNVESNLTECVTTSCSTFQSMEPSNSTNMDLNTTSKSCISESPGPSKEIGTQTLDGTLGKKKKGTKLFLETPNSRIIRKLQLLHGSFKRSENKWRMHVYEKAIMAVRKCNRPIITLEDVQSLEGVAKKIAEKVWEIAQTGQLNAINEVCSKQREATIKLYSKVWGVGPNAAKRLYREGHRSLRDIKGRANLTHAQQIAIRYYNDLKRQIPRPEAEKIVTTVLKRIFQPFQDVQCDVCSSLRRNKMSTGHIDLLITLPEGESNDHKVLPEVVAKLHQDGYLVDDLIRHEENGAQTKYVGVFKFKTEGAKHRRLDITVCTREEHACCILKLTGPAYFNKAIRQVASKQNMILDEHVLKIKIMNLDGSYTEKKLETPTETSVFQCLGLPFRCPILRDPDKSK